MCLYWVFFLPCVWKVNLFAHVFGHLVRMYLTFTRKTDVLTFLGIKIRRVLDHLSWTIRRVLDHLRWTWSETLHHWIMHKTIHIYKHNIIVVSCCDLLWIIFNMTSEYIFGNVFSLNIYNEYRCVLFFWKYNQKDSSPLKLNKKWNFKLNATSINL